MKIVYTHEDFPETMTKSMFLAGPTLRPGQGGTSWRDDAIKILEDKGYNGVVFVPENRDGKWDENFKYDEQVEWEEKCLNACDCIVFWVPRDLEKLPAFTTNIEFGAWATSGKIVFGAPPKAPNNDYLRYYSEKYKIPVGESLTETLTDAMDKIGDGAERSKGERYVPLYIWQLDSFQQWYKLQVVAGNRLDSAKVLYTFRPGFNDFVFMWVLKADVYITSEKRHKTNEFVLSRPDISSILLWKKNKTLGESEIVLVKEFRTPAATEDGFVRELVGGSSKETDNPKAIAAEEVLEETGFAIEPSRLQIHQTRQLAATLSAHKSHLYSFELTDEELKWFKSQKGIVHGKEEDTERTFIEIYTVDELLKDTMTDWVTIGQVLSVWNSQSGEKEESKTDTE